MVQPQNPSLVYVDLVHVENKATKTGRPQRWRWVARNGGNNKIMGQSSERYTNRKDCERAIDVLFGVNSEVYRRESEKGDVELRLPTAVELT